MADLPEGSQARLQTAIEEAIASLEAGMVSGAADTLREALFSCRTTTPKGSQAQWKLVPTTPTQEMCQAGQWKAREWPKFPLRISPIYEAMLNAAPTPELPTDAGIVSALELAGVKFMQFPHGTLKGRMVYTTMGSQPVAKIITGIRAILSAQATKGKP